MHSTVSDADGSRSMGQPEWVNRCDTAMRSMANCARRAGMWALGSHLDNVRSAANRDGYSAGEWAYALRAAAARVEGGSSWDMQDEAAECLREVADQIAPESVEA